MALEQLSLGPARADPDGAANGAESRPAASADGADDGGRTPRLPRWTRQEILVLIQGKKVAENRVRRGRSSGLATGSGPAESKWSSVSNYCKRHGVNRGPVQCRKRWSNLAGDYKKIKEWEARIRDDTESFWIMRNDLRRERRLPGFFDREVYDILDRGPSSSAPAAAPGLDLALGPAAMDVEPEKKAQAAEEADAEGEAVFDSSRGGAAAEDGLFSDFEPEEGSTPDKGAAAAAEAEEVPAAPEPISEKQFESVFRGSRVQGTSNEEQPPGNPELGSTSQEAWKRKRVATDDQEEATTTSLQYHLVDALERNGKLLIAQLEAQNKNSQLDREQRKDQADGLLAILNKLTDALVRIAEKL
ncbi:trihelix transcription factor ASR3 [Punica granatum]|uniref:Myb-like domain-containing protein n=2 Tax=Punica granatum TaxID=22663 RepID=A0A218WVN3_PUNGR|nr:trihelix transcription factor ASR3 [Punica granatum]OWM76291.1 hypothetical protein CDL15_Pgr009937 [Punica granatum]PKI36343.1 hypothetical protein CRG98_043267 [Punica granatum]